MNRFHSAPKFSEAMYRRVGLTTHVGSVGQARQAPANLNEVNSAPYRISDDPQDIDVQRRLAGLTESNLIIPNPAGATRLRPPTGAGVLDLPSTFDSIGLPRDTPRLFESRTSSEIRRDGAHRKLRQLRERKKALLSELRQLEEEIESTAMLEGSALGHGVITARARGGYVLIREREDGSWVGIGKRGKHTGSKEDVLKNMGRDAADMFRSEKDAIARYNDFYRYYRAFMGKYTEEG
jgi:hypothetical protein